MTLPFRSSPVWRRRHATPGAELRERLSQTVYSYCADRVWAAVDIAAWKGSAMAVGATLYALETPIWENEPL